VKQGCFFNPLLFWLYLDALKGHLDDKECDALALAKGPNRRARMAVVFGK